MTDEQFPSIRNLIETDIGPLRRFTGILDSMPRETKTYNEGTANEREGTTLSLNFKDLEVIEAIEPYNYPIFTITLSESNRKKSKYGVFGVSLAEVLDMQYSAAQSDPNSSEYVKPSDRMDLKDCIGKRIGMVVADSDKDNPTGRPAKHMLFDGRAVDETHPKGQDMPTAVWEVYMVEGVGVKGGAGKTPMDEAMSILDGKALAEFTQAALASDLVRSDVQLLQSIGMPATAPNNFANQMVASGKFTKDDKEVFHKV